MNFFVYLILISAGAVGEMLLGLAVSNFLPEPFNHLNLFFLTVVIIIVGWNWRGIFWLAALYGFLLELIGSAVVGTAFLPVLAATVLIIIISERFLTNRSWYSAASLAGCGVVADWIISILFFADYKLLASASFIFMLQALGLELLITVAFTSFLVGMLSFISPRFQRKAQRVFS